MKNKAGICSLALVFTLLVWGCGKGNSSDVSTDGAGSLGTGEQNTAAQTEAGDTSGTETSGNAAADQTSAAVEPGQSNSDMFTNRDYEVGYDESTSVLIQLNGSSISCNSDSVVISGTTATIREEGTYIISGTLDNGMIIVNAEDSDKPQLVFNGVAIHSDTSAPLYIIEADKVFVTLADGTENILSNGGSFEAIDENNIDGAIFSKQDLTFNGSGTLTVNSPADHGIVCKDDLVFTSGTYVVNSASHGLDANDSIRICNASLTVDAGKDGLHAENSDDTSLGFVYVFSGALNIEAEGDGMSAGSYMQIDGGNFSIVSGGGSVNGTKQSSDSWGGFMGGGGRGPRGGGFTSDADSSVSEEDSTSIKGIKTTGSLLINHGTFTIDSADDAIHSNTSVLIHGGTFEIASGDDGVHADETLTITDCTMNISESYEGLEALDLDISGGTISLCASDDGLNAAGGTDSSGFGGDRGGDTFGPGGGMGGHGGIGGNGMGSSSSTGSIVISGGTLYVNASGDGLDANGTLTISGGYTTVCGPTQGDTATLDYDTGGVITGGTFIGTGASGMAQTFSDADQGVIAINVGNQSAGAEITVEDADGNVLFSYAPELPYAVVIFSSPELVSGETYHVDVGSLSGDVTAN